MLTVLHVCNRVSGYGDTTWFLNLARYGDSSKVRHIIVPFECDSVALKRELEDAGATVILLSLSLRHPVKAVTSLVRLIQEQQADIVQTHLAKGNTLGRIAALLTGRPSIVTEHGELRNRTWPVRVLDNLLAPCTGIFISNSAATQRALLRDVPLARLRRHAIVYPGVSPNNADRGCRQSLRRTLGIDHDAIVVGQVGRLEPRKGQDILLQAFAQALQQIPNLALVIVGSGDDVWRESLVSMSSTLGVSDKVLFLGARRDALQLLATFDIFVSASISEGFGLSVAEAMITGLPVIMAETSIASELVSSGESGLTFPVGNSGELARLIVRLAVDGALRSKLGAAGRERIEGYFSVRSFISAMDAVYRAIRSV